MTHPFQRIAVSAATLISLAGCGVHLPQFTIARALFASAQLISYEAVITSGRDATRIAYARPDRCKRTDTNGTTIVVAATAYRKSGAAATWTPMPESPGEILSCAEQPFLYLTHAISADLDDLGPATLDGKPVHTWRARAHGGSRAAQPIFWLDDDDRVARIDGIVERFRTATVRYTDFNAEIAIEAPPLTPGMRVYAAALAAATTLKSVHAVVTSLERTTTIDYTAPTDYARTDAAPAPGTAPARTVHVGRKTYLRRAGAAPDEPRAWSVTNDLRGLNAAYYAFSAVAPRRFFAAGDDVRVDDLGPATLDGAPMHRFRVEPGTPQRGRRKIAWPVTLWIDRAHRLVRVDGFIYGYGDAVVRYSQFDAAPEITAPV